MQWNPTITYQRKTKFCHQNIQLLVSGSSFVVIYKLAINKTLLWNTNLISPLKNAITGFYCTQGHDEQFIRTIHETLVFNIVKIDPNVHCRWISAPIVMSLVGKVVIWPYEGSSIKEFRVLRSSKVANSFKRKMPGIWIDNQNYHVQIILNDNVSTNLTD